MSPGFGEDIISRTKSGEDIISQAKVDSEDIISRAGDDIIYHLTGKTTARTESLKPEVTESTSIVARCVNTHLPRWE